MDETIVIGTAFVMGLAPGMAIIWVAVSKYATDMFKSADETAISEKSNPNLITK